MAKFPIVTLGEIWLQPDVCMALQLAPLITETVLSVWFAT
jgi:hypothetical protein